MRNISSQITDRFAFQYPKRNGLLRLLVCLQAICMLGVTAFVQAEATLSDADQPVYRLVGDSQQFLVPITDPDEPNGLASGEYLRFLGTVSDLETTLFDDATDGS